MRKTLITEIIIQSPVAEVWRILTDFASYPRWNPFMTHISGSLQIGARLHVRIQPEGGKAMLFLPQVLRCELPELRWQGRFLFRGLFDGEHFFQLTDLGHCQTKLVHGESFSGLLVGLFARSLENGTLAGFKQMNEALKQRAEQAGLMPV